MTKNSLSLFKASAGLLVVFVLLMSACKKDNSGTGTNNNNTGNNGSNTGNTTSDYDISSDTTIAYKLLWSDEFDGTSVDQSKWTFETGSLGVNNEKEYYQSANAKVENGMLEIVAKKESVGGFPYTSARMNTLGKFSTAYGRIEARINLPEGVGLWPAFWMLGANINSVSWPNCGEIDIMEHVNADSLIYGTMHWNAGNGAVQYGNSLASSPRQFHVYAVEWDNKKIRWYVDDKVIVEGNIDQNINNTSAFHLPFFIVLNLAVAGDFPGQTVDESKLPATMYVDYVRVYTRQK